MRLVFFPYKLGSASAKLLAKAFNSERVRPDGEFRNNFKRPIINWGNSVRPDWMKRWPNQVILNKPEAVKISSNKLLTFQKFAEHGVKCPEWTTEKVEADNWIRDEYMVVARKTLTGKAGEGIVICTELNKVPAAPLYTKYFKQKYEYRIHVFKGQVIDYALKKQRLGVVVDYKVRNFDGGWVFCREDVIVPICVLSEAIKAVQALGLDFGAVDIGYNEKKDEACIFEVNSAPGIQGTTLVSYINAFKEILG